MKRVVKLPFPEESSIEGPGDLGAAIRAARTGQGMTLEDAAMIIGVAKQTLCDIEAGKATVGVGLVMKVAHELGVSLFMAPANNRERIRSLIRSTCS